MMENISIKYEYLHQYSLRAAVTLSREKREIQLTLLLFGSILVYINIRKAEIKMSYKLELHCHSRDVSTCASVDADTIVQKYKQAGYSGVVLVNHLSVYSFGHMKEASWEDKVEYYINGYRKLKIAAEGNDFDVLFGAEVRFHENANDYLVFGMNEEFLRSCGEVFSMGIGGFSKLAREAGMLVVQAHPFRFGMTVTNPAHLDGIEVYNGHWGHNSNNDIAAHWAEQYNMIKTSGSDFHDANQPISAGIITEERITDNTDLIAALRLGEYELIKIIPPRRG